MLDADNSGQLGSGKGGRVGLMNSIGVILGLYWGYIGGYYRDNGKMETTMQGLGVWNKVLEVGISDHSITTYAWDS